MFIDLYKSSGITLADRWLGVPYPERFGDPAAEYRALTERSGLIDLCHWGVLRLTGKDSVRLLNSLTTNDAAVLDAGQVCFSALTTIKGKLIAELYVLRREGALLVLVSQGDTQTVAAVMNKHIIADDVEVTDLSAHTATFTVEGPGARGIVWRLFPKLAFPAEPRRFVDTDYLGTPVTLCRISVAGGDGYCLIVPADRAGRIRDYAIQSGYADDMSLVGRIAWNTRRVEAGLPWWGADIIAGENFPAECRLETAVSYTKGCFVGQETLARMYHRGHPNWLLVGLAPNGAIAGIDGAVSADIQSDLHNKPLYRVGNTDKHGGRITSAVFSPATGKPLLMGYVRTDLAEPGSQLVIHNNGEDALLTVVPLPVV
jgi:folate-binding protein YgfZ